MKGVIGFEDVHKALAYDGLLDAYNELLATTQNRNNGMVGSSGVNTGVGAGSNATMGDDFFAKNPEAAKDPAKIMEFQKQRGISSLPT